MTEEMGFNNLFRIQDFDDLLNGEVSRRIKPHRRRIAIGCQVVQDNIQCKSLSRYDRGQMT